MVMSVLAGENIQKTMDNFSKIRKQIEINGCIFIISVFVIYLGLFIQSGFNHISWKDGLGAELVFVMISSLGSVVGWRIIEGVKRCFEYNVLIILAGGMFCLEYGIALVVNNSEAVKMWIFYSVFLFIILFICEQWALIGNVRKREPKNKSNSLKYRKR